MTITESIKFNKLQEENETLKKELAELKQQQLYKEVLEREQLVSYEGQLFYKGSIKKEIYEKLPSKEDKTCI